MHCAVWWNWVISTFRMFKIAPDVWDHFPFGKAMIAGEDLSENAEVVAHARHFLSMLDMAIDMLGPDLDLVEEQLQSLGVRHIGYGVMPKHYPLMGRALVLAIKSLLGDSFSGRHEESWNTIYTFLSVSMMQGGFQQLLVIRKDFRKTKAKLAKMKAEAAKAPEGKAERRGSSNSASSTGFSTHSDSTYDYSDKVVAPKITSKMANFFRGIPGGK